MVLNKRLALFGKSSSRKVASTVPVPQEVRQAPEVSPPIVTVEEVLLPSSQQEPLLAHPLSKGIARTQAEPVLPPIEHKLAVTIIPPPSSPSHTTFSSLAEMTATPPHIFNDLHLNLFVLLPSSGPAQIPANVAPVSRAPPLANRQSGSAVTTLSNLAKAPQEADEESDKAPSPDLSSMHAASRRLSLAPGIGSGTQTRSPKLGGFSITPLSTAAITERQSRPSAPQALAAPSPASAASPVSPFGSKPTPPAFGQRNVSASQRTESPESTSRGPSPTGGAPAFGAKSAVPQRALNGRKRPSTASSAIPRAFNQNARGSMALPLGMGLGIGVSGKNRPGWEGDEVVGMLRMSGLEVTVIRHASHLPAILTPRSTSPSYSTFSASRNGPQSRAAESGAATPVILVPLCDSPTLPSLSLLLSQGTTPTAVCFQQDLLDRAKRTEEEWLPSALAQIQVVMQIRDKAIEEGDGTRQVPIVLCYSANPALSASTITACVEAGAAGILKPPYDLETARLVRRMARAAKEGRLSSVVGLAMDELASPTSPTLDNREIAVVLPPTALPVGDGQHEGERILTNRHRRATSGNFNPYEPVRGISPVSLPSSTGARSTSRGRDSSAPSSRKQSRQELSPLPAFSVVPAEADEDDLPVGSNAEADAAKFLLYNPSLQLRRRSVDNGGLQIAMKRAQKAFESASAGSGAGVGAKPTPIPGLAGSSLDTASSMSQRTPTMPSVKPPGMVNGFAFPGTPGRYKPQELANPGDGETTGEGDEVDTHLAELLGAMFYQSCLTINVQMAEYAKLSAPLDPAHRLRLVDALATWDFKPHRLDQGDLYRVARIIFEAVMHVEGIKELNLDQEKMNRLLFAIRAIYHAPNPYHNYIHAIDVLQATYSFLMDIGVVPQWSYLRTMDPKGKAWTRPDEDEMPVGGLGTRRAREVLRPQDVLAVIVAAMGHDVGHPGLSNAFMKNAKTPLSEVYDDKSVLENMHCMLVIQLMRKHGFGFLTSTIEHARDPETARNPARQSFDPKSFRKVLYKTILVTDMSLHFAWIGALKAFGERVEREEVGLMSGDDKEVEVENDRIMLCQAFMKCADISNPTRPIDTSEHWSTVLLEEWAKQASLETDLSLPVSVVASADQALQAKGQIGFIDLFTHPLFEAAADVVPELQPYSNSCAENREIWSRRLEKLQARGQTDLVQPAISNHSVDERFKTLFPLSLPTSLISISCLEPGPLPPSLASSPTTSTFASTLATIASASSVTASASATPRDAGAKAIKIPPVPSTPSSAASAGFPSSLGSPLIPQSPAASASFSPAAKAMRAVYHANLLEQRHRLASVSRGVPIPGVDVVLDAGRRASTPDGLTVHVHQHGQNRGRFDQRFLHA